MNQIPPPPLNTEQIPNFHSRSLLLQNPQDNSNMWLSNNNKSPFSAADLDDDTDPKSGLLSKRHSMTSHISHLRLHFMFTLLHLAFGIFWFSLLVSVIPVCRSAPQLLRPLELPAVAEAIEYQTVLFDVSGGGTRSHPITPYEGPPNPDKDMRWYELMNVGMISLTPEMNATLKYPTQPATEEDNSPLVQLDVFHQLHCLNAIRNIVYGTNKWYHPDDRQDQIHIDHCVDYLRQVIMCHSDVTPITHKIRPKPHHPMLPDWMPNFSVLHTCRNFDKIHEWASKYNASGFVIEAWPGKDPIADLRMEDEQ